MRSGDAEYVRQTLRGDREAYGSLIDSYKGMVFAVALNVTGNYTDSEDVVQEAFLQAYQKLRTLADPAKFASWLYTLTRRIALRFIQERQRLALASAEEVSLEDLESREESPAEIYARNELRRILWNEVAELSPKLREVVLLHYAEDFSIQRAAEFLGITEGAAKMRLKIAREKLRDSVMEHIEGEFRRRVPSDRVRNAVLASIPAAKAPWLLTSAQALKIPIIAAIAKAKVAIVVGAVILVVAGASVLISKTGGSHTPPSGTTAAPVVPSSMDNEDKGNKATVAAELSDQKERNHSGPVAVENVGDDATPPAMEDPSVTPNQTPATPVPPAADLAAISGMVTDENGNPIANIGIYRLKNMNALANPADDAAKTTAFEDASPELLAKTNDRGVYVTDKAPAGSYSIAAYDPKYSFPLLEGINPRGIGLRPGEKQEDVNFQLMRSFSISGKAMDNLHKPVEGAVMFIRSAKFPKGYQSVLRLKARSDSQGQYELKGLPAGSYWVAARLAGHAEDAKMDVPAGSKDVDFMLVPESGIRGRVTIAATGAPAAGVNVTAQGSTQSRGGMHATAVFVLKDGFGKTDSEGYYEIKGLNAGLYPVRVDKWQQADKTLLAAPKNLELAVGQMKENVDFALDEGLSISGCVSEKTTGNPIAGAKVMGTGEDYSLSAVTDNQGVYKMTGVTAKRYFLKVESSGYVMKYILGYNEQGACCATNIHRQLDVLPGQAATGIDFDMDPAGTVMGRVVDSQGKPLTGVDVDLLNDSGLLYNFMWREKFKTDIKGIYKFTDINEGSFYIKATGANYTVGRSDLVPVKTGGVAQVSDIVLSPSGASISGRVSNSANEPLANAAVVAVQVYKPANGRPGNAFHHFHTVGETRTDATGNYEIEMLGQGEIEIQVTASGYDLATKRVPIADLSRKYQENFVLGGTTVIAGIVKDSKGTPLPNAMVLSKLQGGAGEEGNDGVSSKADGSFKLSKIKPNTKHDLNITLHGFADLKISDVPAGKEDVSVVLKKCGTVTGKVVDSATGAPVKDFALFAVSADSDKMSALDADQNKVHSEEGSFLRENLQPGLYRLIIVAPGYQRKEVEQVLVEEEKAGSVSNILLLKGQDESAK